jgi:hypothetical protein
MASKLNSEFDIGRGLSPNYVLHPADVVKLGVYRARTWGGDTLLRAHTHAPRLRLRPVRPKLTPLLCIQEPTIIQRRGSQLISSITGSTIANRVDRSIYREPLAFE